MKASQRLLPLLAAVVILQLLFRFGIPGVWGGIPRFWDFENQLDIAQQISVNAILAFGMTLTILIGGIDLSVGALLALVGTTTVYLLGVSEFAWWELPIIALVAGLGVEVALQQFSIRKTSGGTRPRWSGAAFSVVRAALLAALAFGCGRGDLGHAARFVFALWTALAVATLFGGFNGVCAATTRMPPFIITLATMWVARGAALRFNEGRPMRVPDDQTVFLALGNGRLMGTVPIPVVVMGVLCLLAAVLLHRTRFGQHLYAIGGNREAARYTGIPLVRREVAVYVICSLFTGVAGMIHASQLYSAEPASGVGFELNAIAAAVVGGTSFTGGIGTMGGTLIGAIIIGILDKGLNQAGVHYSFQYMVKGLVILVAVYIDVRRRRG
jgi:ribose transport system permease protein